MTMCVEKDKYLAMEHKLTQIFDILAYIGKYF